jgi:hypothetical protein
MDEWFRCINVSGGVGEADYAYFATKVVPSEADLNSFN